MKCTPGTRSQFHLLNGRLIVYICVMRNFNKKKNALGVARLLSRLAAGRSAPPPTAGVSNYLLWHSGNFTLLFLKRWLDGGAASSSALELEFREVVREKFWKILLLMQSFAWIYILYNCQPEKIQSAERDLRCLVSRHIFKSTVLVHVTLSLQHNTYETSHQSSISNMSVECKLKFIVNCKKNVCFHLFSLLRRTRVFCELLIV